MSMGLIDKRLLGAIWKTGREKRVSGSYRSTFEQTLDEIQAAERTIEAALSDFFVARANIEPPFIWFRDRSKERH